MQWMIIQLSPWAHKNLVKEDIVNAVHRFLKTPDLQVYYPSIEDISGKQSSPYDEYVFVEFKDKLSIRDIEDKDIFLEVLKDTSGNPSLIEDSQLDDIKNKLTINTNVKPGDTVKIIRGSLRGYFGKVSSIDGDQASVSVQMGGEELEALLPFNWIKRKSQKKKPKFGD